MFDVGRSTFSFAYGRVAESGLRHSTRNRAWGNPPWVRIPPLPPVFTSSAPPSPRLRLAEQRREKCNKIRLDLARFRTAYCVSAGGPPLLLVVRPNSQVISGAVGRNSPLIHKPLTEKKPAMIQLKPGISPSALNKPRKTAD